MTMPIALLPMYDWPEVRAETDMLWREIRDACRRRNLEAPDRLTRLDDPAGDQRHKDWILKCWLDPDLLVAQTCGLPYSRYLRGKVQIIGSPVYAIDGCESGDYYSLVIAARDGEIVSVDDISEAHRFGYNNPVSQSGFRAMVQALNGVERMSAWIEDGIETGSHRQSIQAVAEGRADFAAIDAISWLLAMRHEPLAARVAPVGVTPATPGLPMISSAGFDSDLMRDAIEEAIGSLSTQTAHALGMIGFRRRDECEYACFADA